ncbi:unnamed protein product [Paramecium sonneborni]|uniref:Uncharacterized protein n=1 Tax=Paramecium sonneborni TaxID=65129 RepID=A0A8S1MJQ8_9CILI|nr:unnamed protein product [Paramecium sonneborni]
MKRINHIKFIYEQSLLNFIFKAIKSYKLLKYEHYDMHITFILISNFQLSQLQIQKRRYKKKLLIDNQYQIEMNFNNFRKMIDFLKIISKIQKSTNLRDQNTLNKECQDVKKKDQKLIQYFKIIIWKQRRCITFKDRMDDSRICIANIW